MLSYENPAGDFQGITYETPRSGKPLKNRRRKQFVRRLQKRLGTGKNQDYLRRFSLEIRER